MRHELPSAEGVRFTHTVGVLVSFNCQHSLKSLKSLQEELSRSSGSKGIHLSYDFCYCDETTWPKANQAGRVSFLQISL